MYGEYMNDSCNDHHEEQRQVQNMPEWEKPFINAENGYTSKRNRVAVNKLPGDFDIRYCQRSVVFYTAFQ